MFERSVDCTAEELCYNNLTEPLLFRYEDDVSVGFLNEPRIHTAKYLSRVPAEFDGRLFVDETDFWDAIESKVCEVYHVDVDVLTIDEGMELLKYVDSIFNDYERYWTGCIIVELRDHGYSGEEKTDVR